MTVSSIAAPSAQLNGQTAALLKGAAAAGNGKDVETAALDAAKDFESVFLATMLQGMFSGTEAPAPFGGGQGEKVFQSMLTSEYAKQFAQKGGIGLADHVAREIVSLQEGNFDDGR